MKYQIFYSWQSDLPNNTNRGFIGDVINGAIEKIQKSNCCELELSLDRDTIGVPGAPNISQTVMDKIKTADAFVADVSIVTGHKEQGQRLSPNPNVLIELGYAIALLGWERIVLLYNEAYGTAEDLPFDIRQHRRINYRLSQQDEKANTKKNLIAQLKSRLDELLEAGKRPSDIKAPSLSVAWNFIAYSSPDFLEEDSKNTSPTIDIEVAVDSKDVTIRNLHEQLAEIENEDGSIDPKWSSKVEQFKQEVTKFIQGLSEPKISEAFIINNNLDKAVKATLQIENNGNAEATDIRVCIEIPEWLIVFEDIPEPTTSIPNKPKPVKPMAVGLYNSPFMNRDFEVFRRPYDLIGLSAIDNIKRTSGCYIKDSKEFYLWVDRLLHKHELINKKDYFYLLAKPTAPKGHHLLKGQVFCSEFDDWKEVSLFIEVT